MVESVVQAPTHASRSTECFRDPLLAGLPEDSSLATLSLVACAFHRPLLCSPGKRSQNCPKMKQHGIRCATYISDESARREKYSILFQRRVPNFSSGYHQLQYAPSSRRTTHLSTVQTRSLNRSWKHANELLAAELYRSPLAVESGGEKPKQGRSDV